MQTFHGRWLHNEDEMAVEKLSQGIRLRTCFSPLDAFLHLGLFRGFAVDAAKLETIIKEKLQ